MQEHTIKNNFDSDKVTSSSSVARSRVLRTHSFLTANARAVTLIGGTAVVALWTILRHINNGINYDVVGQIGLAQQWSNGQMSGAQLGATSYLLKMPVYFVANMLHFISPMNRLLLLAILFNMATFVLLFVIYEKILDLYKINARSWLYLSMGWLATITGNIFWADYANSRNLEAVGGIWLIYLTLKFLKSKQFSTIAWLATCMIIVFFADPLQLYVCGVGITIFMLLRYIFQRSKEFATETLAIIVAIIAGYAGSQTLVFLSKKLLHVTFLASPNNLPLISYANFITTLHNMTTGTLNIFGADFLRTPYGFSSLREILNATIVTYLMFLLIKTRSASRYVANGLVLVIIVVNYAVYAASGQALKPTTSRYLVMVPLLLVILLVLKSEELSKKYTIKLQYAWFALIITSSTILIGALAISWPNRHSNDAHISTIINFMQNGYYGYALSSREIGLTSTYFAQGKFAILPMACSSNHTIYLTNLFYDNSAFNKFSTYHGEVPIIVPPAGIKYLVDCSVSDVAKQFGAPKSELTIPNIGTAMIYDATSLQITE